MASENIRTSYHRVRQPAEFELYDLQNDPYEFDDLATDRNHAHVLQELKKKLANSALRADRAAERDERRAVESQAPHAIEGRNRRPLCQHSYDKERLELNYLRLL